MWETGNSYPAPITPYEKELKALLDGGGRLFMSGQDILDQAAGTTAFVHDYSVLGATFEDQITLMGQALTWFNAP